MFTVLLFFLQLSHAAPGCNPKDASQCMTMGDAAMIAHPRNLVRAVKHYQIACDAGVNKGCQRLTQMDGIGAEMASNETRSMGDMKSRCAGGDANGCLEYGHLFLVGQTPDPNSARVWLASACALGSAEGCLESGELAYRAEPPDQDISGAADYFEHACEIGDVTGCVLLAKMVEKGVGRAKDPAVALNLYDRGCVLTPGPICNELGVFFLQQGGDVMNAATAFERACDAGDYFGCYHLGVLTMEGGQNFPVDHARAAKALQRACEHQHWTACVKRGKLYEMGKGGTTDHTLAREHYRMGCNHGEKKGCMYLGSLLRSPGNTTEDMRSGLSHWKDACRAGVEDACALVHGAY